MVAAIKTMLSDENAWRIVQSKRKWIYNEAKNKTTRACDVDDVFQSSLLMAFQVLRECRSPKHRRYFFDKIFPLRVARIASDVRWGRVSYLEEMAYNLDAEAYENGKLGIEDILAQFGFTDRGDLVVKETVEWNDLWQQVCEVLRREEIVLVEILFAGYSRAEAASMLGVTRQAVEKRLKKIGEKVRPVLEGYLRER